jgi:2-oxo-4-hydroxy-4-carboxy-5-ureidoimidazoline decarboxylase
MPAIGLAGLNALDDVTAETAFRRCCGSRRWVAELMRRRPFASQAELLAASDAAWQAIDDDDCREAFEAETEHSVPATDDSTAAAAQVALELYRERFGYGFITDAESISADELLMLIRIRLGHDEGPEMRRARSECIRLSRARLARLVEEHT